MAPSSAIEELLTITSVSPSILSEFLSILFSDFFQSSNVNTYRFSICDFLSFFDKCCNVSALEKLILKDLLASLFSMRSDKSYSVDLINDFLILLRDSLS